MSFWRELKKINTSAVCAKIILIARFFRRRPSKRRINLFFTSLRAPWWTLNLISAIQKRQSWRSLRRSYRKNLRLRSKTLRSLLPKKRRLNLNRCNRYLLLRLRIKIYPNLRPFFSLQCKQAVTWQMELGLLQPRWPQRRNCSTSCLDQALFQRLSSRKPLMKCSTGRVLASVSWRCLTTREILEPLQLRQRLAFAKWWTSQIHMRSYLLKVVLKPSSVPSASIFLVKTAQRTT